MNNKSNENKDYNLDLVPTQYITAARKAAESYVEDSSEKNLEKLNIALNDIDIQATGEIPSYLVLIESSKKGLSRPGTSGFTFRGLIA